MQNFKLVLEKNYQFDDINHTANYTRVIIAQDLDIAKKIGEAMAGENVSQNEWLTKLVSAEPTLEDPDVPIWGVVPHEEEF